MHQLFEAAQNSSENKKQGFNKIDSNFLQQNAEFFRRFKKDKRVKKLKPTEITQLLKRINRKLKAKLTQLF